MITQEIVDVAERAYDVATDEFTALCASECIDAALTAVYPLIRQQVLEEAALLFEAYARGADSVGVPPTADYRWVSKQIHNLKVVHNEVSTTTLSLEQIEQDKTDEAHNG